MDMWSILADPISYLLPFAIMMQVLCRINQSVDWDRIERLGTINVLNET